MKHQLSNPYTPKRNGVVERKNRTIIEMARTMLNEFKSPYNFWGEAVATAVHATNRLFLHPFHNKTAYELITGNKPNIMYFKVFGASASSRTKRRGSVNSNLEPLRAYLLDIHRNPMAIDSTTSPPDVLKGLVTWTSTRITAPKWSKLPHVM